MTPDALFQLTCGIGAIGWIVLFFISPFWAGWDKLVVGVVVTLLAAVYTWLNFSNFSMSNIEHFSSLSGVEEVFKNRELVVAAWVHFIAFDLMVAVWEKRNAQRHGIPHWLLLLPLFFTCMLGPLGFLLYILIRAVKTRSYLADNGC